jgi:hypothetical protein
VGTTRRTAERMSTKAMPRKVAITANGTAEKSVEVNA